MVRREDWALALSRYLKGRQHEPFAWGKNDCVLFAADWLLELTGVDYCAELRDYSSEAEALALMNGQSLKDLVIEALGRPLGNYLCARRGDVVLTDLDALGVVDDSGARIAVVTLKGLRRIPLIRATLVWGV